MNPECQIPVDNSYLVLEVTRNNEYNKTVFSHPIPTSSTTSLPVEGLVMNYFYAFTVLSYNVIGKGSSESLSFCKCCNQYIIMFDYNIIVTVCSWK